MARCALILGTQQLIWGIYGRKGIGALDGLLGSSKLPVQLKSAMVLLAKAQYLPSLPKIREIDELDRIISRIGRLRYRKDPGICDKVTPCGPQK